MSGKNSVMLRFSLDTTSTNHCARTYFGDFSFVYLTFGSCTYPTGTSSFTYHPFNVSTMCVLDYIQHLIFFNIQSSNKFKGKPKIVSHYSQESLKQQINIYINIAHHPRGQRHIPVSPQTEYIPFLDSNSFPVTCPTYIRSSCLAMNKTLNTLQWHLFHFHSQICPLTNWSKLLWTIHLSREQFGFPSSDSKDDFPKLLKTFTTSDMDDHKDTSSGKSIDFYKSTNIYAHTRLVYLKQHLHRVGVSLFWSSWQLSEIVEYICNFWHG